MNVRDWTLQYNMLWAAFTPETVNCNCPDGYEPFNGECRKISTLPTEQPPPFTPLLLTPKGNIVYSNYGVRFYDEGYSLEGAGTYTVWNTGGNYWTNPYSNGSSTLGVMNRTAVWTQIATINQQIGFATCINIPEDKTYLLGFGVDNFMILRVDGVDVMHHNEDKYYHDPSGDFNKDDRLFKFWNIYPVTLKKGIHVIEIIGNNDGSVAAVGAEIYNCTKQELMQTTGDNDVDPYLVFSTKYLRNSNSYTNLGTNGYPILDNYALVLCDGDPPYYRKIEYTPCS